MTEESRTKVLKNGAVYDLDKKRIVQGQRLTSAEASALGQRKYQRKREVIAAAAAAAVERGDYRAAYGDDAWIAAIAEAQYIKATTPDDPKSTDAARFLLQETGLSERDAASQPPAAVTLTLSAAGLERLVAVLGGDNNNYRKHGVVTVTADDDDDRESGESGG
jgi:hypothetical protein